MNEFDVLLFAPHLPAHGEKCRAAFEADRLVVNGEAVHTPLDRFGLTLGGFDHKQLFLFWHVQQDGQEVRWAISPASPADEAMLRRVAPAALAGQLQHSARAMTRQNRRARLSLGALGLFLLLPLILLGVLFWQSHNIAGWAAGYISIETEQKLGELAFKQATAGLKLRQSGMDAAAIREIGARLTAGSRYQYQWYVAEDSSINAFAVPGGYVVVNTGLIKAADTAEEVAGVLAHEVQHIEQRHTLKNLVHSLGLRALMALALGDLSGGALGDMAANLSELKFGRDLESESDRLGLASLKKAAIAPQGMVTFFEKLSKQQGAAPPTLLSSHPASEDRMNTLQELIRQQGGWPSTPLPYDWKAIRAGV